MTCPDQASQWISKNEILSEHKNQRWQEEGNSAISQIDLKKCSDVTRYGKSSNAHHIHTKICFK